MDRNNSAKIVAVDLFCGGGVSTGLALACETLERDVRLIAVNHWTKAIQTHSQNHPWAEHHNAKVEELHPPSIVGDDDLDLLVAGPECTHFSSARGGKPVTEQQRASPWHVVDWVQKTRPTHVLIENVPELKSWGPIDSDGQPTRNGKTFQAWVNSIHSLGYSVDWKVLNAADYGDATSRERLFVIGRRDRKVVYPEPTHAEEGHADRAEWRSAAEIIDWSDLGDSIWTRSRPLSNNTMRRVGKGIHQHCGDRLTPYADAVAEIEPEDIKLMQDDIVAVDNIERAADERDDPFLVKGPVSSPDTDDRGGVSTLIMGQHSGARAKDASESSVPTITKTGAIHLIHTEPFILPRNGAFRGLQQ